MSGADLSLVYEALVARADQAAQDLGLPVSMPNVSFTPPQDSDGGFSPYLSVTYMTNTTETSSLAQDSDLNVVGLLQVSVFWPSDDGLVRPVALASRVASYFEPGLVLTQGDVSVYLDRAPLVASSLQESDYVQVPVTVRWRACVPQLS